MENKKISDLDRDTSVSIADYIPVVVSGSTTTKKARISDVLALGGGGGGSSHFVGKYDSLADLQTGVPVGNDGDYGHVDGGSHVIEYIWDSNLNDWVLPVEVPTIDFASIAGDPTDNAALATALNSKVGQAAIDTAINNLVNAAPGSLDTLKELADALGDDPNFAATVTASIGTKEALSNKSTDLSSNDDTHYPTVKAVSDAIAANSPKFPVGFVVNLPVNNTGIPNGTVVNAGDPMAPFIKSAFSQATPPSVNVTTNGNSQAYNQTSINLVVTMSYTILTSGATFAHLKLERSRDNATWTTLLDQNTTASTYNDNGLNASIDNRPIYHRLTITDSAGGTNTATNTVTFANYVAPSISLSVGTATRERGNINTTITGTITRNSPNVALSSYQVQYQVNGTGSWINIGSPITASGSSQAINVNHNDSSLNTSNSLSYRVQVGDAQQTTISGTQTVTFVYRLWYDNVATAPATSADVRAIANTQLANAGNSFTMVTGTTNTNFVIVLPPGKSLVSVLNQENSNQNITSEFIPVSISVNDFGGTPVTYTMYKKTTSIPYSPQNHFSITIA